jgi:GT2 family glycosyltransferase
MPFTEKAAPTVSILMLTHNRLEQTIQCLDSLERTLRGHNVELMVLDNASTDGTERFVADLPILMRSRLPVTVKLEDTNLGVAAGRQKLAQFAEGEILLFLDSDVVVADVMETNWLKQLLAPFADESVGVVGTAGSMVIFATDASNQVPTIFTPSGTGKCDVVSGWCMAVRAGLFQHVAFDMQFSPRWEEDADLCLQVREKGYDVVQVDVDGLEHVPGNDGAEFVDRRGSLQKFRNKWEGQNVVRMEGGW